MHNFGLAIFFFIAAFWVFHGIRVAFGAAKLPRIKDTTPAEAQECPNLSMLFAARDEEEKMPAALATMAEIDYPDLEIVGVDDRSQDAKGEFWTSLRLRMRIFARCMSRSFRKAGLENRTRCKKRMRHQAGNGCCSRTRT